MLEDEIVSYLAGAGGYRTAKIGTNEQWRSDFDSKLGLDLAEMFGFLEETQQAEWNKLVVSHGGDESVSRQKFAKRVAQEIDARGTLDVLRHGVRDQNAHFRLSFKRPAFRAAPELVERYEANRMTVTRQLPFDPSSNQTLDICLLLNGLPVATAELKNHLTGQNIEHAIAQYRKDRDPKNVTLSKRAVVHFAVDPDVVAMTTRLAGESTRFLPFNLGHNLGKGNPPNEDGHKTAYLWKSVWSREPWLDLVHRFIHVEDKGSSDKGGDHRDSVIFPRYHQWNAVRRLEESARSSGAGSSYLIQHSAGSGKSNTIAWLAHRLSNLHDATDSKVFDKVIVITDRVILDRQLQETIFQFEHVRGVVVKIDQDSQQLADALVGEEARIIITTLQKFPFIVDKVEDLKSSTFAVIIDEAHSSQGGEAAKDLRVALSGSEEEVLEESEGEDAALLSAASDPAESTLVKMALARNSTQSNLSYFAFTATPKGKTLELFGTLNPATGLHEPFDLYSMRQAVEEGFIMDVLASYTTYETFWKIQKATTEDPEYDAKKARRAIAKFVSLHPYQLAQKAEIVVEHFLQHTAKEIGGLAKAMVVTSSRLHAVRFKGSIDKYIKNKGYDGLKTLIAFSGKIYDGSEVPMTESSLNGFPESRTAEEFSGAEFSVLIVAEKFQTGFSEPLLHTMYVDKPLVGLAAVQTLSRLNRIHPLKKSTFVLDFRNSVDDIVEAFERYHGLTVAPPTDANILWDTRQQLDNFDVLREPEIEVAVPLILETGPDSNGRSAKVYAALGPCKERLNSMNPEDASEFRDALNRFVRTYSFVSQVVPFSEPILERDYVFCRALLSYVRDSATVERLDLGTEVELTHLRNQITFTGPLALESDTGEVRTFHGEGRGAETSPDMEKLSSVVDLLNERFGTDLTDVDKLLLDQFEESWVTDDELTDQAKHNSLENFELVFDRKFLQTIVTRVDANNDIYKRILDDESFRSELETFYLKKVYERIRKES